MAQKHTPHISFVVCCYNVSDCMDHMLNSILKQEYLLNDNKNMVANSADIEIVLVEDCSSDNNETKKKCQEFVNKFSNVKTVYHENNLGLSAARNSGIKASSGKYISFPDPDDTMCDNIISKYIDCITTEQHDCVCGGLIEKHYDQAGNLSVEKPIIQKPGIFKTKKSIAEQSVLLEKNITFGYAWNKIYKKSIIEKNGLHFEEGLTFIEDLLFNLSFFKCIDNLRIIEWPAIHYNRKLDANKSITAQYKADYFDLHYMRIKELYDYWNDCNVLNIQAKQVLANLYFRYALSAIWRNKNPHSKMTKADQKQWVKDFYKLDLTQKLKDFTCPTSFQTRITFLLFKHQNVGLLLKEAALIDFVTNNMSNIMIKLRQSR